MIEAEGVKVRISGYDKKGHGIADDPKSVQVPGSVRGDLILAKLLKRVKKRHQAEVLELIEPAQERCTPRCKHAGVCGGCTWQQLTYSAQLLEKKRHLDALFAAYKVEEIVPCDDPWHYRSKMEFTFSQSRQGEKFLGLMRSKGRFLVETIEECHIAPEWMSLVLAKVRKWWEESDLSAFQGQDGTGLLKYLTMRWGQNTDAKMVFLTVSGASRSGLSQTALKQFSQAASFDENTSVYLVVEHAIKGKETTFSEMHLAGPPSLKQLILGQTFHLSPRAFFQPNVKMAEKMFSDLIQIVKELKAKKVLDLYCGIGTIGILLAPHVKQVIGVELCAHAISDAKEVIEENKLENIQVFCQDAKTFLTDIEGIYRPDLIIVDPPRTGLGKESVKDLSHLAPQHIIYVSCNPTTQVEDIQGLTDYELTSIRPYDQFPHTVHVETIAILKRKT